MLGPMSTKRRIVHLISSLESGGCENMLLRTLPKLNDDEFEQVVVTLFRPGQLAPLFRERGVRQVSVGGLGRLVPLLRSLKPSLVITYLFHADMLGRLVIQSQLQVPVIAFLRTTYNFARYVPARVAEWLTKGFVRHYLANSEAVKQYYVDQIRVAPERISVIPNGIDPVVVDPGTISTIVKELKLPDDRLVISCVANLAKNKGHAYLLEAFESLAARHGNLWLLLAGSGLEEVALKEHVAKSDSKQRILFLGRRGDVSAILAASDIFVLPTLFEGMSNAVLEAMAAQLPVVTTDIPENRVLIRSGHDGLLVSPKSAAQLRDALARLVSDPELRASLGRAAKVSVEGHFSMASVLDSWRSMLRQWSSA